MTKNKFSVLINTLNEGENLASCLESVRFADEIVIVDMESSDNTVEIAKQYTHLVYSHPKTGFVEPARNFGLAKCSGAWILIVDADEVVPPTLAEKLQELQSKDDLNFVRIPRRNLIFGKFLEHTGWWPDYNIRFFRKDAVTWQDTIHSVPLTTGRGEDLPALPEYALQHHHYRSIDEYLTRTLRYSKVQAGELREQGVEFNFSDAISKPFNEFISRFFASEGYKDGFHGLVLSLLQAFSIFLIYLRLWDAAGFPKQDNLLGSSSWKNLFSTKAKELKYWIYTIKIHLSSSKLHKHFLRLRRKLSL